MRRTKLCRSRPNICANWSEAEIDSRRLPEGRRRSRSQKIGLLSRRIFGKSSEQLDAGQLMLLLHGGDDGAKKDPASSASPGDLVAEINRRGKD